MFRRYSKLRVFNPDQYYPFKINDSFSQIDEQFYNSNTILLFGMFNGHLPRNATFPKAKTLVVLSCSTSIVYHNVNKLLFPNVNTIYLCHSNPYSATVPTRFSQAKWITTESMNYFKHIPSQQVTITEHADKDYLQRTDHGKIQIKWQNEWVDSQYYQFMQHMFWGARLKELLHTTDDEEK